MCCNSSLSLWHFAWQHTNKFCLLNWSIAFFFLIFVFVHEDEIAYLTGYISKWNNCGSFQRILMGSVPTGKIAISFDSYFIPLWSFRNVYKISHFETQNISFRIVFCRRIAMSYKVTQMGSLCLTLEFTFNCIWMFKESVYLWSCNWLQFELVLQCNKLTFFISVKIPFISSMKMAIKPACMIILKEDLGIWHLCISGWVN